MSLARASLCTGKVLLPGTSHPLILSSEYTITPHLLSFSPVLARIRLALVHFARTPWAPSALLREMKQKNKMSQEGRFQVLEIDFKVRGVGRILNLRDLERSKLAISDPCPSVQPTHL